MTNTENTASQYPIVRFGSKWICDGPNGRFAARTKAEAKRLLAETSGQYDEKHEQSVVAARLRRLA